MIHDQHDTNSIWGGEHRQIRCRFSTHINHALAIDAQLHPATKVHKGKNNIIID